ncbi:MAG TPA: sugar porter family MFS transporter [Streptosporangiaceae bacterium]|jgi:sugar porter (SP) family MFS transporter
MASEASGAARTKARYGKAVGVSAAAAVGGLLFGFDSSVINGAVDALTGHFKLTSVMSGLAVSIALIGCAIGAWYAGRLADHWGRRKVMLLSAGLFVVSSVGAGLAFAVWDLMLWRFVAGLSIGAASVIAPAYISEIAPARLRGALASLQQLAITTGIFVALLSDAVLADAADGAAKELWLGTAAWRWMFLVGVVPSVVYGVLALLVPESPRFLAGRGRDAEAASVLGRVSGEPRPDDKVAEIKETLRGERRPSAADIRGPRLGLHPLVWAGIILAALQQLTGINVIFYYSTTLWHSVGFTESDSFTVSVITALTNLVLTFVAIALVDRIGRRLLLLIGSAGMFVGLAAMAVSFSQAHGSGANVTLPSPYDLIALVGANWFVVFFAATWGPVMWVLLSEMFPNRMRATALAIGTAANWLFNFAVTTAFPPAAANLGLTWVYGSFAFFVLLSYFFVQAKIPETKGRTLEEMTGRTQAELRAGAAPTS